MTRELLSWKKVGGRRSEVSESYAFAVSEPSFVLDLLARKDFHSCQITGKILGGVSRVGESLQLSVKISIILLLQEPKYYLYLIDEGDLCQTMRCKDLLKKCSGIVESSVIMADETLDGAVYGPANNRQGGVQPKKSTAVLVSGLDR